MSAREVYNCATNQYHSEPSHSVSESCAATVNRRVASSNLARGATSSF